MASTKINSEIKTCEQCFAKFEITADDLNFYEKVSPVFGGEKYLIPTPTSCPDCRRKNRLCWRNERKLYLRTCDLSNKKIISIFSPDKPFKVYEKDLWWSDKWDQFAAGREFDFSRPFFDQYEELLHHAPLPSLSGADNENCDFVNLESDSKNCYMNIGGHFNKDCYYCTHSLEGKDCLDNYWIIKCELVYGSINSNECYNSALLQNCNNCSDCFIGFDLRNCQNCIGCIGLRNKNYQIFNKPCSREEFAQFKSKLKNRKFLEEATAKARGLFNQTPHKFRLAENLENSSGDYLSQVKNCHYCFQTDDATDSKFLYFCGIMKDVYDNDFVGWAELAYDIVGSMNTYQVAFASVAWKLQNSYYCFNTFHSENLFGCIGLRNAKYCILNKQYTKEEYEKTVPLIIAHMQKTGEWGKFLKPSDTPFCYNETAALLYYPQSKEQAASTGFKWMEAENKNSYEGKLQEVPEDIDQLNEESIKKIYNCPKCNKNFRLILPEIALLQKIGFPHANLCGECRHEERFQQKNPFKLWERTCMCTNEAHTSHQKSSCPNTFQTSYQSTRPEKVYCEDCYLKEVY